MPLIDYVDPDRFVAGTVGPAGQRTFFLQAVDGRRVTSVSLEKAQVAMLAERLEELLDQLGADDDLPAIEPDNAPLTTPIDDEFRVGTLTLAWDPESGRVLVECLDSTVSVEVDETGEPSVAVDEPDSTTLRVAVSPAAAREFARRAGALLEQGRPPCPLCGDPLDPSGHICPRANGYKR
ncbi:DUF3090 family protein [Calidifontibacter indicus]|uniref:Putative repeat protein (TIGR03847 family) n=1 Tax=Calidifontibacter indicus TaxID=419650 RepID=A0A3D9URL6_9MICO|nr:DUF3090 family protein [Calidifontibacter indicus]REF31133.1 putative repeat protein (TIGR03847 family) [Calidifontibacter indicus]